jgi:hypothetical protein
MVAVEERGTAKEEARNRRFIVSDAVPRDETRRDGTRRDETKRDETMTRHPGRRDGYRKRNGYLKIGRSSEASEYE